MNNKSLPRLSAGIVATLAYLIAAPILAQNTTPTAPQTETQAQATPETETPEAVAPAGGTDTGSGEAGTPAIEAPTDATTNGATTPEKPATRDELASEEQPADTAVETDAEAPAESSGFLPQSIHDALAPILNTPERDPNLPHDLSPVGMFLAADWVVKAVMIGLAFASVVTWTVFVVKLLELWGAGANAQSGINRIGRSANLPAALAAAGRRRDPVSRMIRAASQEYDQSAPAFDQASNDGIKERVDSHLERIEALASRSMARGTGILATIGSTAPFVGLFGTVWGIMNSFIGISEAQTTNLAVVAPGIAEALLATALGLIAAIPAVIIYNVFARTIAGYRLRLANAAAGVRRLVSRDLDFRGITPVAASATGA